MGLLDEAIKEHLELKRRRGADPGEIERLEREALGPVRRLQQESSAEAAVPAGEADLAHEEPLYPEELYEEDEFDDEEEYELADEEPGSPSPRAASRPQAPITSHPEPGHLGAHGVVPPEHEPEFDDLTEPEGPGRGEPVHDPGIETVEYDVEAEHAREEGQPEGEEGDMLEETPEFFQDAPDHDRLWFEQRPPRDFDFEG